MNRLLRLTTLSLAIATLGTTGVRAQETTPAPGGTATPTSPTTTPSTTPDTITPVAPTAPATTPTQQGLCNSAMMSSMNTSSDATYTAGPTSENNSVASSSTYTDGANSTTGSYTSNSTGSAYSSEGFRIEAPRLIKAESSQAMEHHEIGPSHKVRLYTGGSPLCYLSVKPVTGVIAEANEKIRVFNRSTGNELGIRVTKESDGGARIVFAQTVPPKTTLDVVLNGVEYYSQTAGAVAQYSLAGGYADYNQEIPYGIAQVNRHLYP